MFNLLVSVFVVGLFVLPVVFTLSDSRVEFGGFFNFYELLGVERDLFAWRFLYALYMSPIVVLVILQTALSNFDTSSLESFYLLIVISGFVNGAAARLQAVFVERDPVVDLFLYLFVTLYFVVYAIPSETMGAILQAENSKSVYSPTILFASVLLFLGTLLSLALYTYRRRCRLETSPF